VRFADLGRGDIAVAGGKGANLGELTRAGLPVPPGFVLTTAAYRAVAGERRDGFTFRPVPEDMAREITEAWAALGGEPVAVRSSATAEDLEEASFAGQQDTYLNVRGAEALLAAVQQCWASLWTERAVAYRAAHGVDPAEVALAVVVQKMVEAEAAGVMFTANPTNGRRDELVLSAAWGLGESVVGGSVTTDDLVVEKASLRVASRTTADKAVMTVYAQERTEEVPVPVERRRAPVLDDKAAAVLAELGVRVEQHYGSPQDIEWARADGEFFLVQSRPITALPEPEAAPPTEWPVPDPKAFYFRASIVEQLPDPLSPLFAAMVDGSVARSLRALMRDFLRVEVAPGGVGLPTVNGYAYYQYSRAAMWQMTVGGTKAMHRLPALGEPHWRDVAHPRYVAAVAAWRDRPLEGLGDAELLDGVQELLDAGTSYYTAVQAIIPLAAFSEVTFTRFYDAFVRRPGEPPASTFLVGFDSAPILAEKSLWDLAEWTRGHPELADAMRADPAAVWAGGGPEPASEWRSKFRVHLDRFGHATYNLDFVHPTPADDPAPLFEALRFALDGGGAGPYARQLAAAARREALTEAVEARLDPARRVTFNRLLRWAQGYAPVREDALADIGLAWPQMRRMLAELGRRLVVVGRIAAPEDVYWLRPDEIAGPVDGPVDLAERKALWRGQRRATPPQALPQHTFVDRFEAWFPASGKQEGAVLHGTGASAGRVTATARVLAGPADFGRMRPGDVLVASITTPAWTSLFTMASAVVTDVGGPLSHSSIVAREYGIPAVLGTGVATRRIPDGARVLVDGDAGTVTLLDEVGDDPAPAPAPTTRKPWRLAAVGAAGAVAVGLWLRRRGG
jgi:rifampicin phosphotransferase